MWIDPIVEGVRKIRRQYIRKFKYDFSSVFAYIKKKGIESIGKIISGIIISMQDYPGSDYGKTAWLGNGGDTRYRDK